MKHLLVFIGCLLLPWLMQAQETTTEVDALNLRLDSVVKANLPSGSNVGIMAYDLTSEKTAYEYQSEMLGRPASTMKLLTSITALSLPQSEEPFRTELWYDGEIKQDTLYGNVYVVGGFDPEFDEEALNLFADNIAALKVRHIAGHVYGDVSMKDSLYWGSGWLWDDNPEAFQPYLSPLMLNKGAVKITATAANAGERAHIVATPASTYYTISNQTVSKQTKAGAFKVTRGWLENDNHIIVSGNISNRGTASINMYRSQDFFMHTLLDQLKARGVVVAQGYGYTELPTNGCKQLVVYLTPMQDVLDQMLKESDNLNAEAMLYRIAAQTTGKKHLSAADGTDAIKKLIGRLGLKADNYRLVDGCGLSNYDYLSPQLLVAFLRYAYTNQSIYQRLLKALPIGGIDGTLKTRMRRGTPSYNVVHAKTGSYTAVNCLAGYLKTRSGHDVAFAIMNQNALSSQAARNFQDKLCDELITTPLLR
ncbi:MAG: D-alanyl-D-alanine carboxypeptidase/D-alanyl-D-alanine-endopeptidase [Bacteroidaceae bacterium]|nr:D-alanyl-D-alanine carboxypeptidase/D-alanyl-D-alanine-endopeptidase [Bacteroidaceae bacterium]